MVWSKGLPPQGRLVLLATRCFRAIDSEGKGVSFYAVDAATAEALIHTGRLSPPIHWVEHLAFVACVRVDDDLIGTDGALLPHQDQVKQACLGWMDLPAPAHLKARTAPPSFPLLDRPLC